MTTDPSGILVAPSAALNLKSRWHDLCCLAATLHFFPRTVQARGSELMSPTTNIQAHTAYEAIDGMNPDLAGSDSRNLLNPVRSANERLGADSASKTAVVPSKERIANVARSLSLDDFGGRSDAPGG
jgi:hypothetical protein